jgi:hypothetical protein
MTDIDYSKLKGVADEPHWNEFVITAGGELVAPRIKQEGIKNADYMFQAAQVIAELKILETEFAHTKETLEKVDALAAKYPGVHPDDQTKPLRRELLLLLRKPLQRIINKANHQIKETKRALGLDAWKGIIICVNDGFRGVPPSIAIGLLAHILSKTSYTNTDALIYQTNHYIEISDSPYANLLWAPMYSNRADHDLVEFVNDLGRKWRAYSQAKIGPFDVSEERDSIDLLHTSVVSGINRNRPYVK